MLATARDQVILGPADDGGYYLIGARSPHAELFADIAWSTASVADETRARARSLDLEVFELPSWYDVDDGADLARLLREIDGAEDAAGLAPYPALATAARLRELGLRERLASFTIR
jgi:glycosyltransferase A (GT-A) superfamily protein (DUF2064 family)